MQQVLCGNVFDNVILKYLDLKDVYKLSLVNRMLHTRMDKKYFYKVMCQRIKTKLVEIMGDKYGDFTNGMRKSKAVLSGSFIHQAILNEQWDNSDIDIYIDEKANIDIKLFLRSSSVYADPDDAEMYKHAFGSVIVDIQNYYLSNKNELNNCVKQLSVSKANLSEDELLFLNSYDYRFDDYTEYDNRKKEILARFIKVQVVTVSANLKEHIRKTGFDVCKNLVTYNMKGEMVLDLFNYRELIFKRSTFIIQNINDFYYRIEKYTNRGFHFRPKYNRLFYVEYLFLKFSHRHILSTKFNFDEYCRVEDRRCGINCPIKMFFPKVRHYHELHASYHGEDTKITIVENKDGLFNNVLSVLTDQNKRYKDFIWKVHNCPDMDEYIKLRSTVSEANFDIYNFNNRFNVQFDMPFFDNKFNFQYVLEYIYNPPKLALLTDDQRSFKISDNKSDKKSKFPSENRWKSSSKPTSESKLALLTDKSKVETQNRFSVLLSK